MYLTFLFGGTTARRICGSAAPAELNHCVRTSEAVGLPTNAPAGFTKDNIQHNATTSPARPSIFTNTHQQTPSSMAIRQCFFIKYGGCLPKRYRGCESNSPSFFNLPLYKYVFDKIEKPNNFCTYRGYIRRTRSHSCQGTVNIQLQHYHKRK